jgi:hypothetical protein
VLRARIRQHITLMLMMVPALCALPALLMVAPAGPIQLSFGAILLITLALALFVGWRLLRLLQTRGEE